jgi:transcriptional regulator with XRE-family HTH domain
MIGLADIGRRLVSARKEKQLNQLELARKAGVSRSTIDLLENGRAREIGYSKLTRILAAVGLELSLHAMTSERPTLDDLLKESSDD